MILLPNSGKLAEHWEPAQLTRHCCLWEAKPLPFASLAFSFQYWTCALALFSKWDITIKELNKYSSFHSFWCSRNYTSYEISNLIQTNICHFWLMMPIKCIHLSGIELLLSCMSIFLIYWYICMYSVQCFTQMALQPLKRFLIYWMPCFE